MKFTCTVSIDAPIDMVVQLFRDPENLIEWQDGFISMEHLSGTPGAVGAQAKLLYQIGRRKMELIETIRVNNLPQEFSGTYAAKSMVNTMNNYFTPLGGKQTRYVANIEYTQFNGLMPKLMAFLVPGMFKKQTQKWLNQFKEFVEREAGSAAE